jgi:hypothetical protein
MPCAAKDSIVSGSSPLGVFDAVDADGREVVQHLLPEAVGCDPSTLVVRGGERGGDGVARPARTQVAGVPVDPVPHDLDPAVATACLLAHGLDQLIGLDLVGVIADVTAGPGNMPAGPDDHRKVVAIIDPPRVGG